MQIQLKQTEIEEALCDFIVKHGFSLKNRTVEISFTAGRGTSGMTADMEISDPINVMPDFEDEGMAEVSPTKPRHLKTVSEDATGVEQKDEPAADVDQPIPTEEPKQDNEVVEKSTSLFGS